MRYYVLILAGFLFLSSCQLVGPCVNKEAFLESLEDHVETAEDNREDWKDEDWKTHNDELEKMMDTCLEKFEGDFTSEEKKEMLGLSAKYIVLKEGDKFEKIFKDLENIDWEKHADDIISIAGDELKTVLKDFVDHDLDDIIEDVSEGIEDLGQELREVLEELKNDN